MPLFKLQTLRGEQKLIFLYREEIVDGAIELLPGVAFCLRQFSGFIRTLAQHGWVQEIRRNAQNAYLAGNGANLDEFLFGNERVPLRQGPRRAAAAPARQVLLLRRSDERSVPRRSLRAVRALAR